VLVYILPTMLGVGLFVVPLVEVFVPALFTALRPVENLQGPALAWTGAGMIVVGRVLTMTAMGQLRRSNAATPFARTGLFRWSRNPGLVGMYVLYLGNSLVFPTVVSLLGFVPYVLNMHSRVLLEESHLLHRLGPTYREYLDRVPRYLLF
jgi:protein-S-isoprenylcysteine O-methyltransferase Ste14